MWSNVISLDKYYEREIGYVLERLKNIKNLSYAIEESRDRIFIYLASVCEAKDSVEDLVLNIMETVYLTFFKLRYFMANLPNLSLNHANCALICSLVHFDREFESNIVAKVLSENVDYNVDGLLNFRMQALTENWEELCSVATKLTEAGGADCDIYDVATFITGTEGGCAQLSFDGSRLFNITCRKNVEIIDLFGEDEYNLLSAIIKEKPSELLLENSPFTQPMLSALKHMTRVISK